jgi:acyl-CoA thioesterase YciA
MNEKEGALPVSPYSSAPAIRVSMMPRDTNAHGTIFGGVILSHIDVAGAIIANAAGAVRLVTVLMREVRFVEPVYVGDVLSLMGEVIRIGTTSLTIRVRVEATRYAPPHETVRVTEAEVVYVNVDDQRHPKPIRPLPAPSPDLQPGSDSLLP